MPEEGCGREKWSFRLIPGALCNQNCCGKQDYKAFYEQEIRYRELLGYPPAEELMAVLAAGEDERLLETGCKYLKEYVLRIKGKAPLEVIGPASPGVDKIKDIYRRVIYIKSTGIQNADPGKRSDGAVY